MIRFTGRKISEFKHEIFIKNFANLRKAITSSFSHQTHMEIQNGINSAGLGVQVAGLGIGCLTDRDLEVLYKGNILDNDDEMEYCFTHSTNPLIVYVPTDLTNEEFKEYTKLAISNLESYKHYGGSIMAEMN